MTRLGGAPAGSLFTCVGGPAAVHELVERLYVRLLADGQVARHFAGVDMPRLKRHQVLLLSQLLGGPAQYDGRALAVAHVGLGITTGDYRVVADHLVAVLHELDAPADVVGAVEEVLRRVEPDVVAPA